MKTQQNKLLIVDDNPRNIQIVGNILLKKVGQIAYATDAAKALEMTAQVQYDLILLDIMMPGMDGFELCEILRRNKNYANVPIIFLTAKADPSSIVKGFELGANDYVTKPFNSSELSARVETHLELFNKTIQLNEFNKELEQKVIERTKQLAFANQQLMHLENAKSDFLALMSHVLRNPLGGVIGLTELLAQTKLSPEQQEYIDTLAKAASNLVSFSELALLITTLRFHNQKADLYPTLIRFTIEIAIDNIRPALKEQGLKIQTEYQQTDLQILIDSNLILKCMELVLENAVKNSPKNGLISVSVHEQDGKYYAVNISDQGTWFEEEEMLLLNDYSFRGQLVAKTGEGLTLAAIKLIMAAHGGLMRVSNLPGGGTNVCLLFQKQ